MIYLICGIAILLWLYAIKQKQIKLNQQYKKHCKKTGQPIDDRLEISEIMDKQIQIIIDAVQERKDNSRNPSAEG